MPELEGYRKSRNAPRGFLAPEPVECNLSEFLRGRMHQKGVATEMVNCILSGRDACGCGRKQEAGGVSPGSVSEETNLGLSNERQKRLVELDWKA
jgi:hypothetical protein